MRVVFRPAEDADRFFIMNVRNAGRMNMTHNQDYITKAEQDSWWFSPQSEFRRIWLAYLIDEDEEHRVGFGMIREMYDSGRLYGTLAVHPEYQGHGIGTAIYKLLTQQVDELWIDVLNSNIPSLQAALKAGFEYYSANDHISTLVYRK